MTKFTTKTYPLVKTILTPRARIVLLFTVQSLFALQFSPSLAQSEESKKLVGDVSGAQIESSRTPPELIVGPVKIDRYDHMEFSTSDSGTIINAKVVVGSSTRGVRVQYSNPKTGEMTVLISDQLIFDAVNNRVSALGNVELTRPDGRFTGSDIEYDLNTGAGHLTRATVRSDYFQMHGESIEIRADGTYLLTNGEFTTCINKRPDYRVRAKSLIYSPKKYVSAKGVTIFLGALALPTLPSYRKSLAHQSGSAFPIPGYSKNEGLTFRLRDSLSTKPYYALDYDLRVNLRKLPSGFVSYQSDLVKTPLNATPPAILFPTLGDPLSGLLERISPPGYREYTESYFDETFKPRSTFYATIQNDQFVYNRRRENLRVSRLPEVGLQFLNLLGHNSSLLKQGEEGGADSELTPAEALRRRVPNASALLNLSASLGYIKEFPTNVSHGRLAIRANLASQPILIGRRIGIRAGVSQFLNAYTNGNLYHMISPEIELDYSPTRTSVFNVAYRYALDNGKTPFEFDERDIRHELRLQYQVSGPWAFGIVSKWDIERSKAYDTEISVVRNFDCIRAGIAYRARTQSVSLIFDFIPPRRDRKVSPNMPVMGNPRK